MSVKEQLEKAQGREKVSLTIDHYLDLKTEGDQVCFHEAHQNDDGEWEDLFYTKPIRGIFVKKAYLLEGYSDNIGVNNRGGMYRSNLIFSHGHPVVLFKPTPQGSKKVYHGDVKGAEDYLKKEARDVKKKGILFIISKSGLIRIETNLSVLIDNTKRKAFNDAKLEYLMELTPMMYDVESSYISKYTKERLGSLAKHNPFRYVEIKPTDTKIASVEEEWNVEEILVNFNQWFENYIKKPINDKSEDPKNTEVNLAEEEDFEDDPFPEANKDLKNSVNAMPDAKNARVMPKTVNSDDDDLPF